MTIDVATGLELAVTRLINSGWQQESYGDWRDPRAPTCAEGALFGACGRDSIPAIAELQIFVGGLAVPHWNDIPGQTKENVIATMMACAAIWRAKTAETVPNAVTEAISA